MEVYIFLILLLSIYPLFFVLTICEVEQYFPLQKYVYARITNRRKNLLVKLDDLLSGFKKIEALSKNEKFKNDIAVIQEQIVSIKNALQRMGKKENQLKAVKFVIYQNDLSRSFREIHHATCTYLENAWKLVLASIALLTQVELPLLKTDVNLIAIRNDAKQIYQGYQILVTDFEKLLDTLKTESENGIETENLEKHIFSLKNELINISGVLELEDAKNENWLLGASRYEEISKRYETLKSNIGMSVAQRKELDKDIQQVKDALFRCTSSVEDINSKGTLANFQGYIAKAEKYFENIRILRKSGKYDDSRIVLNQLYRLLSFLEKLLSSDKTLYELTAIQEKSFDNKIIGEILTGYQRLLNSSQQNNFDQYRNLENDLQRISDQSKVYIKKYNESLINYERKATVMLNKLSVSERRLTQIASFNQEPTLLDLKKLLDQYSTISNNIIELENWLSLGESLYSSIEKYVEKVTDEIRETERLFSAEISFVDVFQYQANGWTFAKRKLEEINNCIGQANQNLKAIGESQSIGELTNSLKAANAFIVASRNLREPILRRITLIQDLKLGIERSLTNLKEGKWSHLTATKRVTTNYTKMLEGLYSFEDYDFLTNRIKEMQQGINKFNNLIQNKETELEMEKEMNQDDKINISHVHLYNSQLFVNNRELVATLKNYGKEDIAQAVTDVSQAILESKNLTKDLKEESIDTLNKFAEETNKEKPNKTFLKSLFNGLKSTLSIAPDVIKIIVASTPIIEKYIS